MAPRDDFVASGVARKYPTNRDKQMGTVDDWIEGKQVDDGAEGLWRIHDDLYDLTTWVTRHPGGRDWIELTRGTDITEPFETHHLWDKAERLLPKFHVRKAKSPRNSLMTFHKNGFYQTLKQKIVKSNLIKETGPTWKTVLLTDSLVAAVFICGLLGAKYSQWWSILSGVFLHMVIVCSHNFFHMKDNFRMYYFNLSLMNYRDWRISHVLSHHHFPNTVFDLEISMWEPLFQYLPKENKTLVNRFLPWIISPIMFISMFHFQFLRRVVHVVSSKKMGFRAEELVQFSLLFFIFLLSGTGIWHSFVTWNVVILTSSTVFGVVGLTAAHHHPDIYHEGDYLGDDKDFGKFQLAAVRDRVEVTANFFLVMISFGDHALHHMFPTIDHGRLPPLYPLFDETCQEYNIDFKLMYCKDLFTGMYQQLARNYKNGRLMIDKKKSN